MQGDNVQFIHYYFALIALPLENEILKDASTIT